MIGVLEYYVMKVIKLLKLWLICRGIFGLKPYKNKSKYILSNVLVLIGVLLEVVVLQERIPSAFVVINLCVFSIIFEEKISKIIKASIVSFFLVESIDSIVYTLIIRIGNFEKNEILGFENKLADILCSLPGLVIWIIIVYFCTKRNRCFCVDSRQYPLLFISSLISTLQIVFVTYFWMGGESNQEYTVRLLIFILMFSSAVCVIYIFLYLAKLLVVDNAQKQAIQAYEKQEEMSRRYYMELYEAREVNRERQHDLRHFLNYLQTRMKDGDYKSVQMMLEEMTSSIYKGDLLVYSQNKVIDAVIFGVLGEAMENRQITFNYQGLLPQELQVSDIDLCTVLSNALENALESTLKSKQSKEICMRASGRGNVLLFHIENPVAESIQEIQQGVTKKGIGHGYGIQSMKRVVEKYHGELTYEIDVNVCKLDIIFLLGLHAQSH